MRKLFLFAAFCLATAAAAFAQPTKYYFMHPLGQEDVLMGSWFILDTEAMTYTADSDSEEVGIVKNYKNVDGKETFDVYFGANLLYSVELVTEENGRKIFTFIYPSMEFGPQRDTPRIIGTQEEYEAARERIYGESASSANTSTDAEAAPENVKEKIQGKVTDKVKNGVNNVLNKGKDLLKKKK